MKKLYDYLSAALERQDTIKEKYKLLCYGLVKYQEEFPFYFKTALDKINVDFENQVYLQDEKETYHVGEQINEKIKQLLSVGIEKGELRKDIEIGPTIFIFWGMLSGFIQIVANKESYIAKGIKLSKQEFLEYGFETLYRSIESVEGKVERNALSTIEFESAEADMGYKNE